MGLFDSIFNKKEKINARYVNSIFETLTGYAPCFTSFGGQLYESELIRSSVDAIARNFSKVKVEAVGNHKNYLKENLKSRPNSFQTWSQFLYRTATILEMQCTCFILPIYNEYDELTGYYSTLPSRCEILQSENGTTFLRYTFANGKKGAVELYRCGILTKFQYKNDFFGTKNDALYSTMDLIAYQQQAIKEAIENGATYRFMAQASNFSMGEDLKKERKRFSDENFKEDSKGGGLLLFPNTYTNIKQIENTPFTIDSKQMELIQTNVFNYFGVNEDILQNKAYGDSWSAFYEGCLEPKAIQLAEVLTLMTYTFNELKWGNKIIVTSSRLQYMSNKDKLDVSAQMADRGLMSINEIRDIWNLPPVEDGDKRTIRGEYYIVGEKNEE